MSRQLDPAVWDNYKQYLSNLTNNDTRNDRIAYAKKYFHVLTTGNASELLTLSNEKRIHVMKSLATLSKFMGCYDRWIDIRHKYQLKWSNGDSLAAFNKLFDNTQNYTTMIETIKKCIANLPESYSSAISYCTLTGLRPDEAFKSIQLIQKDKENYLNKKLMILEHYKYPEVFIRRTKKTYISVVTSEILELANGTKCLSYDAMNMFAKRNNISMRMSYCRKIFATHLRLKGLEQETIDLLQGRVPKSIFAKHYFRPDSNFKKIRLILASLQKSLS